jgi:hypothetical protein
MPPAVVAERAFESAVRTFTTSTKTNNKIDQIFHDEQTFSNTLLATTSNYNTTD